MPPRIAAYLLVIACASIIGAVHTAALPASSRAWSATGRQVDDADLRRMIGQMVLVGFVGSSPNAKGYRTVLKQAGEGKIGGVIYLGRNIRSLEQVRLLNEGLQRVSKVRLFIAVDQEGGRIERLTKAVGFEEIPSAAAVSRLMSPDEARKVYERLASGLARQGFNLNLGPVVDLNVNDANPIIGRLGRSFSDDPRRVGAYAKAFVEGHRAKGVLTALKHFPGHGSSASDSHTGAADVTRTWNKTELLPYRTLIASGDAEIVMSAHVINGNLSGRERVPSSLSSATLTTLLRESLRFKGVVISDDMQMGAIEERTNFEEAVREAVLAGNDILVFANDKHPDPLIPEKVAALLLEEAHRNPGMLARIRESHARVMRLKDKFAPAASPEASTSKKSLGHWLRTGLDNIF
jgi:beta-N-acetylhexosaminidase